MLRAALLFIAMMVRRLQLAVDRSRSGHGSSSSSSSAEWQQLQQEWSQVDAVRSLLRTAAIFPGRAGSPASSGVQNAADRRAPTFWPRRDFDVARHVGSGGRHGAVAESPGGRSVGLRHSADAAAAPADAASADQRLAAAGESAASPEEADEEEEDPWVDERGGGGLHMFLSIDDQGSLIPQLLQKHAWWVNAATSRPEPTTASGEEDRPATAPIGTVPSDTPGDIKITLRPHGGGGPTVGGILNAVPALFGPAVPAALAPVALGGSSSTKGLVAELRAAQPLTAHLDLSPHLRLELQQLTATELRRRAAEAGLTAQELAGAGSFVGGASR